jgi:hypothetical protein
MLREVLLDFPYSCYDMEILWVYNFPYSCYDMKILQVYNFPHNCYDMETLRVYNFPYSCYDVETLWVYNYPYSCYEWKYYELITQSAPVNMKYLMGLGIQTVTYYKILSRVGGGGTCDWYCEF